MCLCFDKTVLSEIGSVDLIKPNIIHVTEIEFRTLRGYDAVF